MQDGFKHSGGDDVAKDISSLGKADFKRLLDSLDTFIFDCDGVLWHVDHVFPESSKLITLLRKLGKKVCFITNNTLYSHEEHLARFKTAGIHIEKEEYVFPTQVLCHHLNKIQFKGKIEYLGGPTARKELTSKGFDLNDDKVFSLTVKDEKEFLKVVLETEPVSAVVVDIDLNSNFKKVTRVAHIFKSNPDCLYFSTAPDKKQPMTKSLNGPGPGCVLAMVEELTGRKSEVMGKPSAKMFELLKYRFSLDPRKTVFIGDAIDSDIGMAKNCGIRSILVLTGSAKREHIPYNDPLKRPSYVSEGVAELLSLIENA